MPIPSISRAFNALSKETERLIGWSPLTTKLESPPNFFKRLQEPPI